MRRVVAALVMVGLAVGLRGATLLIEAESFVNHGGWVVDQQFMDQMGSPFLMAHGLGVPVADASTTVEVKEGGNYRFLVRTRNWAAPWSSEDAPGQFQLKVNGKALPVTLGKTGEAWDWHEAGALNLKAGKVELALHDLTGFNGRCDAVVMTTERGFKPPSEQMPLESYRRTVKSITSPSERIEADLVVVGGGIPGVCASITAARLGLKVILLQDRPVLGGNNSSEVRVHLGGRQNLDPYPRIGDIVSEIGPARGGNAQPGDFYEDDRKLAVVEAEKNITLLLNTRGVGIEMNGSRITAVVGRNTLTGAEQCYVAPLFLDATGDGAIGVMAGAEYRYGREGRDETGEPTAPEVADNMVMGSSVQWYSREAGKATKFPDIKWGLKFTEENCERVKMGEWTWETGMNRHQITEFERIRDYGMLVIFSNWAFLKNHSAGRDSYAKSELEWVAYVAGKRESRRLIGDLVLREQDLLERISYPDGTACTTWTIDLHYPDPKNSKFFPGNEFKSIARHKPIYPYQLPYRCFYSRNVDNLFMAGRNISVTHVVLGTIRLMRTGGMMGEVVGMAAAVCHKNKCQPRDIYQKHFDDLKAVMERGVGKGEPQPPQNYNLGGTLMKK